MQYMRKRENSRLLEREEQELKGFKRKCILD